MKFRFDELKAAQVAAHLIERHGGTLNYMKLVKLMYLADRAALLSLGAPITGDRTFSLKHGTILSEVLNLVRGVSTAQIWSRYVGHHVGYDVSALESPDMRALSEEELVILEQTDKEYGGMTPWELRQFTHGLPEWEDPDDSCIEIPIEKILDVARADQSTREKVKERAENAEFLEEIRRAAAG